MTTQSFSFGSGNVFAIPTSGLSDTTPVQFGVLQDISVDFAFTNKELMGQNQFAVAVARATGKITGKAKAATFSARAFNLVFGTTLSNSTQNNVSAGETATVPGATTYTVTPANAATFLQDMGVLYASTGKAFSKVASAPMLGQYSVNATSGVYTFAAADASTAVLLSYTYSTASGNKMTITNQLAGVQPVVKLVLQQGYNGVFCELELNQAIFNKLSLDFKNEDFTVPELDFECFADAAGNIGSISMVTA